MNTARFRTLATMLHLATAPLVATSDAAAAPELGELQGVWKASFNNDTSRIIVQMRDGNLGLWDSDSGEAISGELGSLTAKGQYVVDSGARRVLIGFEDGKSRVFDFKNGQPLSPPLDASFMEHRAPAAVFTPDGSRVAIMDKGGSCRIFEVATGKRVADIPLPAGSEEREIEPRILFTPDGKTTLLLDPTGTLHKLDAEWKRSGSPMVHPNKSAYHIAASVSDDGRHAVTFDSPGENGPDGELQLWDLATCRPLGDPVSDQNGISGQFLAGNDRLLIAPGRGETRVVKIPSLELEFKLPRHDNVEASRALVTADGSKVFSFGYDPNVRLTDLGTGKHAGIFSSRARIESILTGPDASTAWLVYDNTAFLLEGHHDGYVIRLDLKTMRPAASLRLTDYLHRTILSPDGTRLMTHTGGSDRERVRVFDAVSLKELSVTSAGH
ncbi:WD40 repeat domain-containing protein [Luteolibacter marinus]|uniref:WD40 repeat domain-containing protein n=1 Tax=Luteolibacter marinus TaxID=2776705 RepID=UPI00186812D7|nr:WD40 repeat domain-containing protein [Luteolibacter marinus]